MSPEDVYQLIAAPPPETLEDKIGLEAADLVREYIPSGMVVEEDLNHLASVVYRLQPVDSIEIGLASGSTAITIMKSKRNGGLHLAMDCGQTNDYQGLGVNRINAAGLAGGFRLIEKFSFIGLPELLATETTRYDFAYIDSNHMFDHTLIEWFYLDRLLKTGGVIGFDDVHWPMVHAVTNFVEANCAYKFYKPTQRTWFGVKLKDDDRSWFDYKPFVVPWGGHYEGMIDSVTKIVRGSSK